ncbi:voltage-dependent T-type calcium channel subunit alpha-1G-like [Anneissia japonica]|uniref:voltage-dependent T-type calcium channel subunit alpha-1G-like n=1 Tax=Anneissia japonica TaxID=1529436 RepID=UPI00142566FB|nr:voltage-dependent T-type calcium channel subunit alpha-1G-like [Anneissia japonica]
MLIIILNCVTLGMYRPCEDTTCDSRRCLVLAGFDHFIFAFFAVEMVIKMIAMGILGKLGYMKESWNKLDFFIVAAGTLEYSLDLDGVNLSAIRTIRVLRPLRAINRVPSLRILVVLLLDTLPMLGNVLLLCFFVFFIFGIIGVQLWKGLLRNRCYLDDNVTFPNLTEFYKPDDPYTDYVCSLPTDKGMLSCEDQTIRPAYPIDNVQCNNTLYFNNFTEKCTNWNQYYTECKTSPENPFLGSISFDNILYAWVAIFQIISLEGWVDIQYLLQDSHSKWVWIYFVFLIVVSKYNNANHPGFRIMHLRLSSHSIFG